MSFFDDFERRFREKQAEMEQRFDSKFRQFRGEETPTVNNSVKGYYWCNAAGRRIPLEAIKAGIDKDRSYLYVGRAHHSGDLLPAKVAPNHGCAFVAWGGEEHRKLEFEILCRRGPCTVTWQEAENGAVPQGALPVGRTSRNETLYVGRVYHDGTLMPGKIHPSHRTCYISYGGAEISHSFYEVLIL